MSANAVHSLYGGAVARNALAGHAGKPQAERPQEVHTPDWILDAARTAFGGRIRLDPCGASVPSGWFADVTLTGPGGVMDGARGVLPLDGLAAPWADGTFWNPPFVDLQAWQVKAAGETGAQIGLFPVRTHRPWFLRNLAGFTLIFLDYKVIFKGHKNAFPAPLCLAARGCTVPALGRRETGRWEIG